MNGLIGQAARDVRLPEGHNVVWLSQKPRRWDEFLDLSIPVFISHTCQSWWELGLELWKAGLSEFHKLRLAEESGTVQPVAMEDGVLSPSPGGDGWTLILNWTHPDEGWRARLPLWGKSYVVTRQREQSEALVKSLEKLGGRVIAVPAIEFTEPDSTSAIETAFQDLSRFHWVVFTSPNGVRCFFRRLQEAGLDHRAMAPARFACIGPGTAKALADAGFKNDLLPSEYVAEGLLKAMPDDLNSVSVLIPRAQEAREVLPETLEARGAEVVVAPVYKTVQPAPPADLDRFLERETRVLFTSSSTVKNWVKLSGRTDCPCYCIGPVTAGTAEENGFRILGVASEHTIEGLVRLVREQDQ